MEHLEQLNVVDNPNELIVNDSEIVTGKLDGEPIVVIQLYIDGKWHTQFGLTDTSLLVLYHKVKKKCQMKGLL